MDLQREIRIRNASRHSHSAVSFINIYPMRSRAVCKRTLEEHLKQENDGVRFCNAEKDLRKVNSAFLMHSELSELLLLFIIIYYFIIIEWSLNSCKFQVCNIFFRF